MCNGHQLELSREARTHVHPADNDSARVRSAVCPILYFHGRTAVLLCPSLPALCSSEWVSISLHHISGLRCPLAAASGKPRRRSEGERGEKSEYFFPATSRHGCSLSGNGFPPKLSSCQAGPPPSPSPLWPLVASSSPCLFSAGGGNQLFSIAKPPGASIYLLGSQNAAHTSVSSSCLAR